MPDPLWNDTVQSLLDVIDEQKTTQEELDMFIRTYPHFLWAIRARIEAEAKMTCHVCGVTGKEAQSGYRTVLNGKVVYLCTKCSRKPLSEIFKPAR
jgi:hypothetical protein